MTTPPVAGPAASGAVGTRPPADAVHVRVPAKVNLQLTVGPRRADGFHELATVFMAVGLYDDLVARPGDGVTVRTVGEQAALVPDDGTNLAVRAALALAAATGRDVHAPGAGVRLAVRKGIPVAGGMAGGSADAAAALVACNRLWGTGLSALELVRLAADLGSDVAFPLVGGTALGTGRGELLEPVPCRVPRHWVVALDAGTLSTPAVFAELDRARGDAAGTWPAPVPDADLLAALTTDDHDRLAAALTNDLQPAALALHPGLHATLEAGLAAGATAGCVSGSGPTVFFAAPDAARARRVADALGASAAVRAVHTAVGPVPGALDTVGPARPGPATDGLLED